MDVVFTALTLRIREKVRERDIIIKVEWIREFYVWEEEENLLFFCSTNEWKTRFVSLKKEKLLSRNQKCAAHNILATCLWEMSLSRATISPHNFHSITREREEKLLYSRAFLSSEFLSFTTLKKIAPLRYNFWFSLLFLSKVGEVSFHCFSSAWHGFRKLCLSSLFTLTPSSLEWKKKEWRRK